jgi:hypothetical protein
MKAFTVLTVLSTAFTIHAVAMTTDQFAQTTQKIIADSNFAEYQPTVIFPARQHIEVLAGAAANLSEAKIVEWAAKQAVDGEEFLVAFKTDNDHFKIVRCVSGKQTESKVYATR